MKLLSMTLRRQNVRGKLSISYRWNVIWSKDLRNILVVECYGYSSDKGYAWCLNPPELAEFMQKRLTRFGYDSNRGDVLRPEDPEEINYDGLNRRLIEWSEKNEWPSDMKKAWDTALYRFRNGPMLDNSDNGNEELVHNMVTSLVPLEVSDFEDFIVTNDDPEHKVAGWGAW